MLPAQLKNKWFWIYFILVVAVLFSLKTSISPLLKIVLLIVLIVVQFFYNKNVKYGAGIDVINWILFVNMFLIFLAYTFAFFNQYEIAVLFLLLMITVTLVATALSYAIHLWKIKDGKIKKPAWKLVSVIILYLALAANTVLLFTFFYNVTESFPGNNIVYTGSTTAVTGLDNLYVYSGTIFYTSLFGNMVPTGASRWITLLEYAVGCVIHIIILGNVVSAVLTDKE